MGLLQSQMKHFKFSSLGLKQYQQHLCDHKWGQLMTDPLINSSTIKSHETHERLIPQIVTEHLCAKQVSTTMCKLVLQQKQDRNQVSQV